MVSAVKSLWERTAVRSVLFFGALGFAPFYLLSLAVANIH